MLIDLREAIQETQQQLQSIRESLSFPDLNQTQLQVIEALSLVEGLEAIQSQSGSKDNLSTLQSVQETLQSFNSVLSHMLELNHTQAELAQVMTSVMQLQSEAPPYSYQTSDPDSAAPPRAPISA
ncbi:uncharacterized protein LOC112343870 [Selaginella moellendorffii]|uniref:uncharacterized protein LOC112343870 n=1 Tax=Selaginella moellendorffii TaxID=88036 RepID=UPI000D1C27D5|nr:uncharacterized protein LOC112343870 [Selaginella moellendorffii]|eukprot:XP_024523707.1 uncharacterized protein LOC112343870 [Selaginella moellendorffii]